MTGAGKSEHRIGAATAPTRLVSRIYRMRALGLGTGFFVVASGLHQNGASPLTWALLFANAFAAYATAAVLVSQGQPIVPLMIRQAITSEVLLGQANAGFALALEMIVVVTVVMVGYNLLLRRAARWMR